MLTSGQGWRAEGRESVRAPEKPALTFTNRGAAF